MRVWAGWTRRGARQDPQYLRKTSSSIGLSGGQWHDRAVTARLFESVTGCSCIARALRPLQGDDRLHADVEKPAVDRAFAIPPSLEVAFCPSSDVSAHLGDAIRQCRCYGGIAMPFTYGEIVGPLPWQSVSFSRPSAMSNSTAARMASTTVGLISAPRFHNKPTPFAIARPGGTTLP